MAVIARRESRKGRFRSRTAEIIAEIVHGEVFGTPEQGVHWVWDHETQ